MHHSHEDCLGSVPLSSRRALDLFPGPLRAKCWAEPSPPAMVLRGAGAQGCVHPLWGHGHVAWTPGAATGLPAPQMPLDALGLTALGNTVSSFLLVERYLREKVCEQNTSVSGAPAGKSRCAPPGAGSAHLSPASTGWTMPPCGAVPGPGDGWAASRTSNPPDARAPCPHRWHNQNAPRCG